MRYNKPPVSFLDQVHVLKERGLDFQDEEQAAHTLSYISFYRLRAYTYPFQDNGNPDHPFTVKVDFETIIKLYNFDRKLRFLVFDAIEKIEIALRTQIIYHLAMQYGSHWQMDPTLFRNEERYHNHLFKLQEEIDRSDETFIKHYNKKYTAPSQPPSWMSMEVASLGTLSKFYQNLKGCPEKEAVATNFGLKDFRTLENWSLCFSNLRNICAHHGRLWNRRLTAQPKLPYNTINPFMSKQEVKSVYPNKIYATLCCMHYLLKNIDNEYRFKDKLKTLVRKCPLEQEKDMGFPADWLDQPVWN